MISVHIARLSLTRICYSGVRALSSLSVRMLLVSRKKKK